MPKSPVKKTKKTFIAKVVIKSRSRKVPDFGLGKGVLGSQEITFTDQNGRGFDSPLFALARIEHEDRLRREVVEVQWIEKPSEANFGCGVCDYKIKKPCKMCKGCTYE